MPATMAFVRFFDSKGWRLIAAAQIGKHIPLAAAGAKTAKP